LKKLRNIVNKYEVAIAEALYNDLKKSPEESYATERGLLLSEINITLKNLRHWMHPKTVGTDLANFGSASKIYRDPLGVVLIISPWNYPFQLLMIPLVGAIAGGNCAVLKPSELAPATAAVTEKMIAEIFPPDYVKVVQGDGSEIVPAMMNNFRFDHVFYTGSTVIGKSIYKMAAEQLVPVTLELGGKSPAIVDRDTNISVAARRIILGKFINAGQTCIAPDYVLVHQDVKEEFIRKLNETIIQFYTIDPASSYDYGRIINEKRFDKLVSYMTQGRVVFGGKYDRPTLFITPTILDNVSLDSSLMSEEIFGPLLPVIAYHSMEEAMHMEELNANPLAFYLFTNNKSVERKWIERTAFGGGCINNTAWQFANYHLPFGGVGESGIGAYHGKYTFERFTHSKPVMKTPLWLDPSIKYPPMKGRLKLFKWLIR
jgi:aldehyde dehydrogenase (NAD+)